MILRSIGREDDIVHIGVAIYGESFCNAARNAFRTLASNALRLATISFIGDFLLFLIKVAIVTCTVFSGMELGKVSFIPNFE